MFEPPMLADVPCSTPPEIVVVPVHVPDPVRICVPLPALVKTIRLPVAASLSAIVPLNEPDPLSTPTVMLPSP